MTAWPNGSDLKLLLSHQLGVCGSLKTNPYSFKSYLQCGNHHGGHTLNLDLCSFWDHTVFASWKKLPSEALRILSILLSFPHLYSSLFPLLFPLPTSVLISFPLLSFFLFSYHPLSPYFSLLCPILSYLLSLVLYHAYVHYSSYFPQSQLLLCKCNFISDFLFHSL